MLILAVAASLCLLQDSWTSVPRAESEHYQLWAETAPTEADEWLELLEQLHDHLAELFGRAPAGTQEQKLPIYFFEELRGMYALARSFEETTPRYEPPGVCFTESRRVFVTRRATAEATRSLLLHEATHQFELALHEAVDHEHSSTAAFLREGLAEVMEHHRWDGERLSIPTVPEFQADSSFVEALAFVRRRGFAFSSAFDDSMEGPQSSHGRARAHLFVRYVLHECDKRTRRRFLRFLEELDRGQAFEERDLWASIGSWESHAQRFRKWVPTLDPEWGVVYGTFELSEEGATGGGTGLHVMRTGSPVRKISCSARLLPGEEGDVGLLVQYQPYSWNTYAMVSPSGGFRLFAYDGRQSREMASAQVAPNEDGTWRLEASRRSEVVRIRVNGTLVHELRVVEPTCLGLAAGNTRAEFTRLSVSKR